jgi:hypothetical protein
VLSTYLGHACVSDTYWYLSACPELMQEAGASPRSAMGGHAMKKNTAICNVATSIERYFTDRLVRQRNVSVNTIAAYRDTFRRGGSVMIRLTRRRSICTPTLHSRRQPWRSSSPTNAASQPASAPAMIACSPSSMRCDEQTMPNGRETPVASWMTAAGN